MVTAQSKRFQNQHNMLQGVQSLICRHIPSVAVSVLRARGSFREIVGAGKALRNNTIGEQRHDLLVSLIFLLQLVQSYEYVSDTYIRT